jgi:hypothetical protein
VLEVRRETHRRNVGAPDPNDRTIEVEHRLLGDRRRDLSAGAVRPVVLVHHHGLPRLANGREDRLGVERIDRPNVDDLGLHTLLVLQSRRRLETHVQHQPVRDHGEVVSLALDVRLADRNDERLVGHVSLDQPVRPLVLQEQDRVRIVDRRAEHPGRVVRRRRNDHLEAGDVAVERLDRLGVVQRAVHAAAVRRANDHR